MKFLKNVPVLLKVVTVTLAFRRFNQPIKAAAEQNDQELQRQIILQATSQWAEKILKIAKVDINILGKKICRITVQ